MIKLFNATDTEFYSNGIMTIHPLKLKEVKQKGLNGWHIEVETDLKHKDLLEQDMLAVVKTKSKLRPQAFRINNITSTQNKLSFTANHVMFDAHDYYLVDIRPTEMGAVGALNYVNDRTDIPSPFTFTSDVNNSATAYFIDRSLFYAMQVIEERWGGVFDADNWGISLSNSIGVDRGETIAYGKNLQDIKVVEDWSKVVTKLYAVGFDGLRLPEVYLQADVTYDVPYTKRVDFETKYEEDEDRTEENLLPELRENAEAYLLENKYPKVAYEVKSDINQLVEIGDTIHVKHPLVMLETEVQEYEYNVLTQRVVKIVFGNYNRSVKKRFDKIKTDIEDVKKQTSKFEVIVGDQTDLINNLNKFGHVYIDDNQILILDALPKENALNVWRWNLGGLGFSSTGIEGPFTQAWTMDGVFNTDFIAANSISASRINFDGATGNNVDLSGTITATSGKVGGFDISSGNLVGNAVSLKPNEITIGNATLRAQSEFRPAVVLDGDGLWVGSGKNNNDDAWIRLNRNIGVVEVARYKPDGVLVRSDFLEPATVSAAVSRIGSNNGRYGNIYLLNQPNVLSDTRYKYDIQDIDPLLLEIIGREVKPKQYRTHFDDKIHFGYIAQDVERALYKYCGNDKDKYAMLFKDESYMSLLYGELNVIIEAYHRLQNEKLEERIAVLERRNNDNEK